jgi:hypothetical protein
MKSRSLVQRVSQSSSLRRWVPTRRLVSAGYLLAPSKLMQSPAIAFLALVVAVALVLGIWDHVGPIAYQGGDGKLFQTLAATSLRFAPFLEVNILNPLQGLFSPQLPTNVWLNPVYAVFHITGPAAGLNVSTAIAYVAMAIATYAVARVCGFDPAIAIMSGIATIAAFPPFLFIFGLTTQFMVIPATAFTMALWTALLALVIRPPGGVILSGGVYSIVLLYTLYIDPMFFATGLIGHLPFFAVFMLVGGRELIQIRLLALLLAAALLYLFGVVEYALAFVRYTARSYLLSEAFRPADPVYASVLFSNPISSGILYLILGSGWLMGAFFGSALVRVFCIGCIIGFMSLVVMIAVFLFGGFPWPAPAPFYSEIAIYHLYILGGLGGWATAVPRIAQVLGFDPGKRPNVLHLARIVCVALPLVGLGLLFKISPGLHNFYNEPWPEENAVFTQLKALTSFASNPTFRGSVAVVPVSYYTLMTAIDLWRAAVPTLNEYGQMVTPLYHYAGTRIFSGADGPHLNGIFLQNPEIGPLALMGVRFVVTDHEFPELEETGKAVSRWNDADRTVAGRASQWRIYELSNPNLGNYSPTDILRVDSAEDSVGLLKDPSIDFRRQVILSSDNRVPTLVPVQSAKFSVERGQINILAHSEGTSLVVLPIQFSRCLELQGSGEMRLVRANLFLTGLIFERSADAKIEFKFGLFDAKCRQADIADLKKLHLEPRVPVAARSPFTIDSPNQVPVVFAKLAERVSQAAGADTVFLPIFNWIKHLVD